MLDKEKTNKYNKYNDAYSQYIFITESVTIFDSTSHAFICVCVFLCERLNKVVS